MVPSVFACDDLCGNLFVCVTPSKSEEARFCLTIRVMFCCWCGEYTMDILQTGWRKASSFFKSTVDVFSASPPQRRTWSQTEAIVIACEIEPLDLELALLYVPKVTYEFSANGEEFRCTEMIRQRPNFARTASCWSDLSEVLKFG